MYAAHGSYIVSGPRDPRWGPFTFRGFLMLTVSLGKQLMQAGPSQNISVDVMGEVGALILPLVRLKSCIYIYIQYIYKIIHM